MKIDTSKIEGYAEMTPEQKLAAMPWVMMFLLGHLASGLVIYWTWVEKSGKNTRTTTAGYSIQSYAFSRI